MEMVRYVSEFIGTMFLVFLGDGVNANLSLKGTFSKGAGWVVTAIGWATAVALPASIMGPIGGGHFNPALTIGHAVAGLFDWALVPGYVVAQMLGGIVGAVLVWLFFKPHFDAEEDPGTILGVFSTGPAIPNTPFNFISEFMATFVLVFLLILVPGTLGGGLNVWLVIMILGMALGGTTGYALNPARDTAPRIAHMFLPIKNKGSSNWSYGWIPLVASICGGIVGAVSGSGLANYFAG